MAGEQQVAFESAISKFIDKYFEKLAPADPETSKYILFFFAVSFIVLTAISIIAFYKRGKLGSGEIKEKLDALENAMRSQHEETLKDQIADLKNQVQRYETDPPRIMIEKIYLKANGWANAGLLLCIAMIIFETSKLSVQIKFLLDRIEWKKKTETFNAVMSFVSDEGKAFSYALAAYLLFSAIILAIAVDATGRSVSIINRSFAVCLLIALATFGIFFIWRGSSLVGL